MWYNPMMTWLLKSPFHGMVSKGVMLVSVTSYKTDKYISTPTNYVRDGNILWIVSWRDRKWWRNLRGGADVRVLLAGRSMEGHGQVIEEENAVAQSLFEYYQKVPRYAKYIQISLDDSSRPIFADCERAAQKMVVAMIDLQKPNDMSKI